jgi:hypothetical protein
MLTALNSQYALAANLDAKRLMICPVGGSVLDDLVKASCTDDAIFIKSEGGYGYTAQSVVAKTNQPDLVTGRLVHQELMDEVVNKIHAIIGNHLLHTRTVVVPMINDFVARIEAPLAAASRDSALDLEIKTYALPTPYAVPSLLEEIENARDVKVMDLPMGVGFPLITDAEQALDLIKSGQGALDDAVLDMLSALPQGALLDVINKVFGRSNSGDGSLINYFRENDAYPVIAYLVARKNWDKPLEGVEVSLSTYEQRMTAVRDQAARAMHGVLYIANRDARAGILIKSYTRQTIVVNQDVYLPWLENGGNTDILFGAVVSGNVAIRAEELTESAAQYEQAWKTYRAINATAEANQRFASCKTIARSEMIDTLAAAPHDVVPVASRSVILADFERELALTSEDEVRDPHNWVMRLITKSIFLQTDAFSILSAMHTVRQANPGISASEAAAAAGAQYLAEWMALQFRVEAISG